MNMEILPTNQLHKIPDEDENGGNCISEHVADQENRKFHCDSLMKERYGLSSAKMKAKSKKIDTNEVHGGRIIRSTGRKDRHSKVRTARGTRDRRLRLSPKTAILFYDVQDRLGYDRPSKAIDWLMKEAKAAIDALDDQPPPAATKITEIHNQNQQILLKTESGISQKPEHLTNGTPIGFFNERAAPSSSVEFYLDDNNVNAVTTPSNIFDADLENARLQRNFSWNYANAGEAGENYSSLSSLPLHFPATANLGHSYVFSQRETLQSRITNYSPQFPGVGFSNEELPNFTAATTFKEDEMDNNIRVSSKSSSTASFLQCEEERDSLSAW